MNSELSEGVPSCREGSSLSPGSEATGPVPAQRASDDPRGNRPQSPPSETGKLSPVLRSPCPPSGEPRRAPTAIERPRGERRALREVNCALQGLRLASGGQLASGQENASPNVPIGARATPANWWLDEAEAEEHEVSVRLVGSQLGYYSDIAGYENPLTCGMQARQGGNYS